MVSEEIPAMNVTECMTSVTANGQPVAFSVQNGAMINDANITMTDVIASNGIIHVIDKVLTPIDNPLRYSKELQSVLEFTITLDWE